MPTPTLPSRLRTAFVAVLAVLVMACGSGDTLLPALTDDSTCEDAVTIVTTAIDEARSYVGTGRDDPALRDELVFALSAVDERPECVDEELTRQATGLRSTLNGL